MTGHIRTDEADGIGVVTIDRRAHRNRFDEETARQLGEALKCFSEAEGVRVIVLRGAGDVFCAGVDLDAGVAREDGARLERIVKHVHAGIAEIGRAPKPVIAAVDGVAASCGFEMAMACDLVLASERASFEWDARGLGVAGCESSTQLLPRLIGMRAAMEILFMSPTVDALAARELRLVNAVHPVSRFRSEVMSLAGRLASGPTGVYARTKALVHRAVRLEDLGEAVVETRGRAAPRARSRAGS